MKSTSLCHRAAMNHPAGTSPLLRSFERHLRALNRSDNTIASCLDGARQAEAFLAARGRTFTDARRADASPSIRAAPSLRHVRDHPAAVSSPPLAPANAPMVHCSPRTIFGSSVERTAKLHPLWHEQTVG
jgi:hypothetical protein